MNTLASRPWTDRYSPGVPTDVTVPDEPVTAALYRAAERWPDRVAVDFFGATTTYAQLVAQVERAASALHDLGVRHGDRVALVHLKDYRVALPSAQAYEKLRAGDPGPVREALFTPQFAEVGEGSLAMADVVRTAVEIGAAHCFVEQDATYERDEFDAVALSYRHLTELGFGDLLTRA